MSTACFKKSAYSISGITVVESRPIALGSFKKLRSSEEISEAGYNKILRFIQNESRKLFSYIKAMQQ